MKKWYQKLFNDFNIKIICIALVIAMLVSLFFATATNIRRVNADNYYYLNLDKTTVQADLKSLYNNVPNNYNDFEFINFTEYGYTENSEFRNLTYSLYVYVFKKGSFNNSNQKIKLATKFNDTIVSENSKATNYTNFIMEYISSYAVNSGYYFKYKIKDTSNKLLNLFMPELRRYDVAGIEIDQTDYAVDKTYIYTGFTKGLGSSEEDTLKCKVKRLDTLTLNVNHTFYRTQTSSRDVGYQHQLDTVYFSVPKSYFTKYGKLQRIKAEWYEFLTKDIIVTHDSEVYDILTSSIGKSYLPDNKVLASSIVALPGSHTKGPFIFRCEDFAFLAQFAENTVDSIYWVLPTKDWQYIETYDPNRDYTTNGGTAENAVIEYLYNYDKTFNSGSFTINGHTISKDLLQSDIEDYRKVNNEIGVIQSGFNGKSYYDFDADIDLISWTTWNDTEHSFWENWSKWGLWTTLFNEIPNDTGMSDISPIYIVTNDDLELSNEELAEKILVNVRDIPNIRQAYQKAHSFQNENGELKEQEELVLFRFALSDYYARTLDFADTDDYLEPVKYACAYNARESIFLDFDIIQLTFKDETELTVIPVVSNSIDIVDDLTPPQVVEDTDSWFNSLYKKILNILLWIGIVIAVIILILLLPYIISIFNIIFKAIKSLIVSITKIFKNIKKERNGRKKGKK